jgi:hypothetical protein
MSTDYEKAVNALTKDVKDLRADMKDVIAAVKAKAGSYVDDAKAPRRSRSALSSACWRRWASDGSWAG